MAAAASSERSRSSVTKSADAGNGVGRPAAAISKMIGRDTR
jgi:hypothetical protein